MRASAKCRSWVWVLLLWSRSWGCIGRYVGEQVLRYSTRMRVLPATGVDLTGALLSEGSRRLYPRGGLRCAAQASDGSLTMSLDLERGAPIGQGAELS